MIGLTELKSYGRSKILHLTLSTRVGSVARVLVVQTSTTETLTQLSLQAPSRPTSLPLPGTEQQSGPGQSTRRTGCRYAQLECDPLHWKGTWDMGMYIQVE